MLKSQTK